MTLKALLEKDACFECLVDKRKRRELDIGKVPELRTRYEYEYFAQAILYA